MAATKISTPTSPVCVIVGAGPGNGAAFAAIIQDLGRIDALIYNAGKGVWGKALAIGEADFEAAWRVNAFGAFLAARLALPALSRKPVYCPKSAYTGSASASAVVREESRP